MQSELHFEVPVIDLSVPLTHLVLNATAVLVDHLEDSGLLAKSKPVWTLNQQKMCLECDIRVIPAEPADPVPIIPIAEVECPECAHRFKVI